MVGIIGGDYGLIEPGAIHKVYLIWPTLVSYENFNLKLI